MDSTTKNRKSRAELEQMTRRAFDGVGLADGDDAVVELHDGWFNVAYLVHLADDQTVVLKIAPPPGAEVMAYEQDIITTEVTTMRLVHQNPAIPVPEIYAFDTSGELCDAPYFFMEQLHGDNLHHVRGELEAETARAIREQTGAIVREINAFTGDWFGYPGNPDLRAATWPAAFETIMDSVLADAARKDADCGIDHDRIRAAIAEHRRALNEVTIPRLVHWDAWDPNWFVRDGRVVGLLDFERALWADPLMEAQFRTFGGPANDAMRGYGTTTLTPAEERRCQLYTLHLGLVMNTECAYRNYDTDDIWHRSRAITAAALAALDRD